MMVRTFAVSWLLTNCYIAGCRQTKEAIIVDPGFDDPHEADMVFRLIAENLLKPKLIVNTHGHPDHVCGNGTAKKKFHASILIHEGDAYMLGKLRGKDADMLGFINSSPPADSLLHEGDLIRFGKETLKVIHTPGHSRGGISLIGEKEAFTGDTLFAGSIGRTDFPESSEADMNSSLKRLAALPDDLIVYPGHGPATTIAEEKRSNPFLQ